MRRLPLLATLLFLAVVALLGCEGLHITDPDPGEECDIRDDGGVCVLLDVPATVGQTDTLVARLRYVNLRPVPVTVASAYGCNAFVGVFRGDTRIPFPATDYFCTTAFSSFTLGPHEAHTDTWTLPIGPDETPLEPGSYRFEADLNTHGRTLVRAFEVR
ncbi:MAG: hypothetical protein ACOCUW_01620 [Gemmatimonadota bacterium]